MQMDIDAARKQLQADKGSLHFARAGGKPARFDGFDKPQSRDGITGRTAPAKKAGLIMMALCIGLPAFHHHIGRQRTGPVFDGPFDADSLAFHFGACQHVELFLRAQIEPRMGGHGADMHIGTGGLGGGFF